MRVRRKEVEDSESVVQIPNKPILSSTAPVLTISEDFTMNLADRFCDALQESRVRYGSGVILLNIGSMGGDIFALMRMINALDGNFDRVITYCSSHAYSSAAELLACGTKGYRFAGELSSMMIHPMSTQVGNQTIEDVVAQANHFQELNTMLTRRLAKNLGMKPEKLMRYFQQLDRRQLWLTPDEALKFGLIDHIGNPKLELVSEIRVTA